MAYQVLHNDVYTDICVCERLVACQSTPAMAGRGVCVESCIAAGSISRPPDIEVCEYLLEHGVVRWICGHKPIGDTPLVLHAGVCIRHASFDIPNLECTSDHHDDPLMVHQT